MAKQPTTIPAPPAAPASTPTPPPAPPVDSAPDTGSMAMPDNTPPAAPPTPPEPPKAPVTESEKIVSEQTGAASVNENDPNNTSASEQAALAAKAASPNGAVTVDAEKKGGVKASDYQESPPDDDDDTASIDGKDQKRQQKISAKAFRAGRKGSPLGKQRKSLTDVEWAVYVAAHQRGVAQGDADELSDEERIARLERALGLPVPNAEVYEEVEED